MGGRPLRGALAGPAIAVLLAVAAGSAGADPRHGATTAPHDDPLPPVVLWAQFGDDPAGREAFLTTKPVLDAAFTAEGRATGGDLELLAFYPVHAAVEEAPGAGFPSYRTAAAWSVPFVPGAPATALWVLSVPPLERADLDLHAFLTLTTRLVAQAATGASEVLAEGQASLPLLPGGLQRTVVAVDLGVPSRGVAPEESLVVRLSWSSRIEPGRTLPDPVPPSHAGVHGLTVHAASRVVLPLAETLRLEGPQVRAVLGELLVKARVRHAFNAAFIDRLNVSLAVLAPASESLVASPSTVYDRDPYGPGLAAIAFEWLLPGLGPSLEGRYEATVRAPEVGGERAASGTAPYEVAAPAAVDLGPQGLPALPLLAMGALGIAALCARWAKTRFWMASS